MKPVSSPLNIIDFALLNVEFNYIQPKGTKEIDIKKAFNTYDLDIDFAIDNDEIIQVFIKSEINRGKIRKPGYSIFVEIVCLFEFNSKLKLSEQDKKNIEGFSTIYIALNALRGFISQITANAPFGRYILPSVDLNDLINQKHAKSKLKKSTIPKKRTAKK